MKYRLELSKGNNLAWRWFVQTARRHPGYSTFRDGPFTVHAVETDDKETILAFWSMVRPFKRMRCYYDGHFVSPTRFGLLLMYGDRTKRMLGAVIERGEARLRENRRRMGLDPDGP